MNRKERRAAQKRGQTQVSTLTQVNKLGQAVALAQAGQLLAAEAACREYLASHPGDIDGEHLLGQIALSAGRPDLAVEKFHRTAAARKDPHFACDLATALTLLRRPEEATDVFKRATERWPSDRRAAVGLAAILSDQGRHAEAVAAYRRVVALDPDSAAAHNGLGAALLAAGDRAGASRHLLEAMKRAPEVLHTYTDVIATFSRLRPDVMAAVARANEVWPQRPGLDDLAGAGGLPGLAADEFLLWLLESHTICNLALERWATGLRFALSVPRDNPSSKEAVLRLACALARQGFLNDYVFASTPEEDAAAAMVRQEVAAALTDGRQPASLKLAVSAMYTPLGTLPAATTLATHDYPPPLAAVVRQQVVEPQAELADRAAIPRFTRIAQDTSIAVRGQYEESPYPRWVDPPSAPPPLTVAAELRGNFPHAPLLGLPDDRDLDVLIAGCGTGYQSVEFARRLSRVRITAIDLSLTSLAYARRRTAELKISNISYGQADLIEFAALGHTYDVVESVGVLHHLADLFAGWRALFALVRPGGVMKVGLYSEIARRNIVAAREWLAARGYTASPQDIRRGRHDLLAGEFPNRMPLPPDFYSVSECRDLLFHVQEHRTSLPAIAAFLAEQNAAFLGFLLPPATLEAYRRRFPNDPSMTSLDRWHQFETDNPDTFLGMYQFWIEKRR